MTTRRALLTTLLCAPLGCARCSPEPDPGPAIRAAEARFDAVALQGALDRIDAWLRKRAPAIHPDLQPGLTDAQIDDRLAGRPITEELRMLYRWHNGMKPSSNAPLVWYHTFLPLDAALKATPGIGFLVFEGERFYVLPETGSRARPVHHDFGEVPERPIVHTNLTTMMVMWADAFASGAVTLKAPTDTAFQTDDATLRRLHGKHDATATFPYAAP